MAIKIIPQDLASFIENIDNDLVDGLIPGVIARAVLVAPCIASADLDESVEQGLRAILIDALVRRYWALKKSGTSAATDTFGPFSYTERYGSSSEPLFTAKEEDDLRKLCMIASGADPASGVASALESFPDAEDYDQFFARPSDYYGYRYPLRWNE